VVLWAVGLVISFELPTRGEAHTDLVLALFRALVFRSGISYLKP
ncbi:unnamed protein product, partial [Acidithrix sp. C25]